MIKSGFVLSLCMALVLSVSFTTDDTRILSYIADPAKQHIQLFWKNDKGENMRSIANLKTFVESKKQKLLFAMNGGMYMTDYRPLGLYIEDGIEKKKINTATGYGNFYLKPNGIFYITNAGKAVVCTTEDFRKDKNILYATQSGPMLVINGRIHSVFTKGSKNVQIRNGVGVLPDGKVLFAMSKTEVSLYDFADYFLKAGCKNALFLDGFVCRTYLPEKNRKQTDGDFGVMIGVTQP